MSGEQTTPSQSKRRARAWRWVAGALLALLLLMAGVAWWAASEGSLPRALQLAQRLLPDDQSLSFTDARGSLTGGGSIRQLRWSGPGTTLTIDDLQLEWTLRLLRRELRVHTLSAANVHVRLTPRPEDPQEPFVMPSRVSLPLKVSIPLDIARLQVDSGDGNAASIRVFNDLAVRYAFDGEQHLLDVDSFRYGESRLQARVQLDAGTLAISAQVAASLRDLVPDAPLAMLGRLQASGTLAGGDEARLNLQLDARQRPHDALPPDAANLLSQLADLRAAIDADPGVSPAEARIHAQTTIHPWRQQPLQQMLVQFIHVDLHAFLEAAPLTAFRGEIRLDPVSAGDSRWNAVMDLVNESPGQWDRQRLPLRRLAADAGVSLDAVDIGSAHAELGGSSTGGVLNVAGQVWLRQPARSKLEMRLQALDLRTLMTSLPVTGIAGALTIEPWQEAGWQAQANIRNAMPGPLDRDRAPLDELLAHLRFAPSGWSIEALQARIGDGSLQVRGQYAPATTALELHGELRQIPLRQIHRKMSSDLASQLSGSASVSGNANRQISFSADLASSGSASTGSGEWEIRSVQTSGIWSPTRLTVKNIHLDGFQAMIDGNDIEVALPGLDSIKAQLTAVAPGVSIAADAAMQKQTGGGKLSLHLTSAEQTEQWIRSLPLPEHLLPDAHARGAAMLDADWEGGWSQWLSGMKNPSAHPELRLNAVARTDGLRIDLPGAAGEPGTRVDVRKLDLNVQGNLAAATVAITGDASAGETRAILDVAAQATQVRGDGAAPRWKIAMDRFMASANLRGHSQPWQLQVSDDLEVDIVPGASLELVASAGRATLVPPDDANLGNEPLVVKWEPLQWRRSAGGAHTLQTRGAITGIQPAWIDVLLARKAGDGPIEGAGMSTDLSLSGEWDVRMTESLAIKAHVQRERGDLTLVGPGIAAGIRAIDLQAQSSGEDVNLALDWDTERAGVITARLGTRVEQRADGWSLPDSAPVSGSVQARLQNLTTWAFLAPPGWRLAGSLDADLRLDGTVREPLFTGNVEGKGLNLRSVLDGVDLHNGTLRANLSGSRMEVAELTFEGGTGSRAYVRGFSGNRTPPPAARGRMTASGHIDWSGVRDAGAGQSGIAMNLKARLEKMQVLVRNDRQMSLSGDLSAGLGAGVLTVNGKLAVDRASIVLPEASAPTLGDDVVVVRNADLRNPGAVEARQARGELRTRRPMNMDIQLDLGNDLALEGQGITTRLEGELSVRSAGNSSDPFSVFGEVRTDEGRYRAWGQALDVETGVVRFNGPYSNPSLDLLAIRPEIDVRAGVRVTGTLNAPRVQLYSDPDLPEGEKLSWVVLGRPAVVGGAEGSSMQQAALGIAAGQLSGKLASGIGLDELGLAESGVTVGKRLSNELYLTYEAGLSGAASTLFIFYDITRRLTVRAQTGDTSAMDLVYTITYD